MQKSIGSQDGSAMPILISMSEKIGYIYAHTRAVSRLACFDHEKDFVLVAPYHLPFMAGMDLPRRSRASQTGARPGD
jgi:hypothetical protein